MLHDIALYKFNIHIHIQSVKRSTLTAQREVLCYHLQTGLWSREEKWKEER